MRENLNALCLALLFAAWFAAHHSRLTILTILTIRCSLGRARLFPVSIEASFQPLSPYNSGKFLRLC